MLSNLFGGPRFSGSYFDSILAEAMGWVMLFGCGPSAVVVLYEGHSLIGGFMIMTATLGVMSIISAYVFRYGFNRGRRYQPPPLGSMPSIGPPM